MYGFASNCHNQHWTSLPGKRLLSKKVPTSSKYGGVNNSMMSFDQNRALFIHLWIFSTKYWNMLSAPDRGMRVTYKTSGVKTIKMK